jgi:arginyl-tRNA synthetase
MYATVERKLLALLKESIECAFPDAALARSVTPPCDNLSLDIPKEKEFGDLSCSVAMKLASVWRKSPRQVAEVIAAKLTELSLAQGDKSLINKVEIKGAGFINIFLKDEVFLDMLVSIHKEGRAFGSSDMGGGAKVLLEFVSANPTGALSVAHARQAAVGDALGNVLRAVGYDVTKEFYLNDEGNQINILGRSIGLRYKELGGEAIEFPPEYYQGSYITDLAAVLFNDPASKKKIAAMTNEAREDYFRDYGVEKILEIIRGELDNFGVRFDVWYSQKVLGASGKVEEALDELRAKNFIYDAEGAIWFKSTQFGDDKDRVVRKSDGAYTYLAPDIAYHRDKFSRGFQRLINIWGPDHHGYIPRPWAMTRGRCPLSSFSWRRSFATANLCRCRPARGSM